MLVIALSILLVAIAISAISVKLWLKKDGSFAGTCSSHNPVLKNEDGTCGICGARYGESCKS